MLKDKIVELRKANNDTQDCLAKKLSVSRSLIAKWEQGRAVPNATYIKKIYEIYNVSYDQMIKLDEILSYKKKGDKKFIISVIIGELILLTSISIVFLINDLVFNFKKISLLYFIAFLFFVLAIIFIIFVNAKKYVKNVDFNGKIVVPTLITLSSVFFILY